MDRRDVERRLEAAGRSPAPGPTPEFVEGLSRTLRSGGTSRVRRLPVRTLGAVTAGAAAAAVLAAVLVSSPPGPDGVRLAAAFDAVAVLPDGRRVAASAGQELPDGTIVRTGPSGRVRADGFELGPDGEATVSDGRLVVRRPESTARPASRPSPEPTPVPSREPRPTDVPGATRPPAATPTPSPVRSTMRLSCEPERGAVGCRWSAYEGRGFSAYRLWRDDASGRRVVFRTEDHATTAYRDADVFAGQTYAYAVEAVDGAGRVLASGGPVRVRTEPAEATPLPVPTATPAVRDPVRP